MKRPLFAFPAAWQALILAPAWVLADAPASGQPASVRPVWSNQRGAEINRLADFKTSVRPVWSDRQGRKVNFLADRSNPVRPLKSTVQRHPPRRPEPRGETDARRIGWGASGGQAAVDRIFSKRSSARSAQSKHSVFRGNSKMERFYGEGEVMQRLFGDGKRGYNSGRFAPLTRTGALSLDGRTLTHESITEGETRTSTMGSDPRVIVHRDSRGSKIGESTVRSDGTVLHRDWRGVKTGESLIRWDGTISHRDAAGRTMDRPSLP